MLIAMDHGNKQCLPLGKYNPKDIQKFQLLVNSQFRS